MVEFSLQVPILIFRVCHWTDAWMWWGFVPAAGVGMTMFMRDVPLRSDVTAAPKLALPWQPARPAILTR